MNVNIITLGCSKNTVDSENLAGRLREMGHTVFFDGVAVGDGKTSLTQHTSFDAVIVNTCGFIGDAKEESINTILQQIKGKERKKSVKLIACGCLVERYRDELASEIPEVDAWFGVHEWEAIAESLRGVGEDSASTASCTVRPLSTPGHYAYLKIAEGCDRRCSYCAIPLIRGAHRSRPMEELVEEAKRLVTGGVKELLVISQDTTFYGLDLYHHRALGELLERLASESGAEWIRLHYTYPASFPTDALDAMRRHDNICNYIDIPLQHINSRILGSMHRGIDREGTLALLRRFREEVPGVSVRTTLIVGYPGETLEEFEELKAFVREARFDRMGCFAYSPEEGTEAFRLADDVPQQEKERRVAELMEVQEAISLEKNQERVGQTYRVLVDGRQGDYLVGRTEHDSPEVDDEVLISLPAHGRLPRPGDFVTVRVTQALEHDLMAELV